MQTKFFDSYEPTKFVPRIRTKGIPNVSVAYKERMSDVSIVHKKNTYTQRFQFSGVGDCIQDISGRAETVIWNYASSSA